MSAKDSAITQDSDPVLLQTVSTAHAAGQLEVESSEVQSASSNSIPPDDIEPTPAFPPV